MAMPSSHATGRAARFVAALLLAGAIAGCATTGPAIARDQGAVGLASYYAREHDGQRTASGERFDMRAMTAAHRTLPFGTRVRVTNLENGRQAVVRVNDRGPFRKGRIIDVSYAAARALGLVQQGVARVRVDVL
jgi:rare lipoprotein A